MNAVLLQRNAYPFTPKTQQIRQPAQGVCRKVGGGPLPGGHGLPPPNRQALFRGAAQGEVLEGVERVGHWLMRTNGRHRGAHASSRLVFVCCACWVCKRGLPPLCPPSAPQDRQLQSSAEWRKQMAQVDRSVFSQLREGIKGGFDEDRFGSRIGFGNLKRWGALAGGATLRIAPRVERQSMLEHPLQAPALRATQNAHACKRRRCMAVVPNPNPEGSWKRSWRAATARPRPPPWPCCRRAARRWQRSWLRWRGASRPAQTWRLCGGRVGGAARRRDASGGAGNLGICAGPVELCLPHSQSSRMRPQTSTIVPVEQSQASTLANRDGVRGGDVLPRGGHPERQQRPRPLAARPHHRGRARALQHGAGGVSVP